MLARLLRETQYLLVTANGDRLALLAGPVTVKGYRSYLARIYGFEAPVEAAFTRTPDLHEAIDLRGRTRLRLLRADLLALGIVDPSRLPACGTVPAFRSTTEALGWMYALEHNVQVHGQLHRRLARHLADHLAVAGSYLGAGTRSLGGRLNELGAALDRHANAPTTAMLIVDAARLAFRRQHAWFAGYSINPQLGTAVAAPSTFTSIIEPR
jgi:heme oxygenase